MNPLRELYQEMILDHGRRPRNRGTIDDTPHRADGHNPLCGDRLSLSLELDDDRRILRARFTGQGCAISTASASLMTEAIEGKTAEETEELFRSFHDLVTVEGGEDHHPELGKLAVFAGVREFPVRVKCATLAWHTLRAALEGEETAATTE